MLNLSVRVAAVEPPRPNPTAEDCAVVITVFPKTVVALFKILFAVRPALSVLCSSIVNVNVA